jgi:hypothetical protein
MSNRQQWIEAYLDAKDGNRPHLMRRSFAHDAELTVHVKTEDIAFPPVIRGRDEITRIMVSGFAALYENVYTFCIGAPPDEASGRFVCDWIVCMTEKSSGAPRLGFGQYVWRFGQAGVSSLGIKIEEMRVLGREYAMPILEWADSMAYPWCDPQQLSQNLPELDVLQRVAALITLRRKGVLRT